MIVLYLVRYMNGLTSLCAERKEHILTSQSAEELFCRSKDLVDGPATVLFGLFLLLAMK